MKKHSEIDSSRLPRDPATGEPLTPMCTPGYYPVFSTLSQSPFWDDATRQVVTKRLEPARVVEFFSRGGI